MKAIRTGKTETDTAILPKFLAATFYISPRMGDLMTRFFLPRQYRHPR